MRVTRFVALGVLAWLVSGAAGVTAQVARRAPTDAAVKARVDALLARMSLDEKIGQLNQAGAVALVPGAPRIEDVVRIRSFVIRHGHLSLALIADGWIYEFEPTTEPR
jgi:hypothetical protein